MKLMELFTGLVTAFSKIGDLKNANLYDEDFATIEFTEDGKTYKVSVRCDKDKENNNE